MGLLFAVSLFSANSLKAQIGQGTILIEPYYGFASTGKSLLTVYNQSGTSTVSSLGPVGLRFNYMLSEKFGLGIDGNHQAMSLDYTDGTFNYTVSRNVFRVMLNTHLIILSEASFQLYGNIGAGFRNPAWTFTSDDPNYIEETVPGIMPVAFKLGLGGRYMFTDNLGIHAEVNLGGGSNANGGLSFAF